MRYFFTTLMILVLSLANLNASEEDESKFDKYFTDEDGYFDASKWLGSAYGFLPVPIIITGPTFGNGLGLNLMFLHDKLTGKESESGKYVPPSISGVVAGKTENSTAFGAAYHLGFFKEDTIRTKTFLGKPDAYMYFYPTIGGTEKKVEVNLDGWIFYQEALMRVKESNFFVGLNYLHIDFETSPTSIQSPILEDLLKQNSKTDSLGLMVEYDTRDSIFTPNSGSQVNINISRYKTNLEEKSTFNKFQMKAYNFETFKKDFVLGLRFEGNHVDGNAPFYMYPSIDLRGIALGRYQGSSTALVETELRWDFTNKWSLLGFVGTGKAFGTDKLGNEENFSEADFKTTKGVGFRYEIARAFKIRGGVDLAFDPDDKASVYITVGSAWR
jgi:hypothetical protein